MTEEIIEFKSKVEELVPTYELDFDPTPAFGMYRKYFPDEAVRHPAKANTNLIKYLVEKYTNPGDTILDPMAGTGSTCVVASLHGRNAICVDIEDRFYDWMLKAKEIVEKTDTLTPKGKILVLKGDARRLTELFGKHRDKIDVVITSPPYSGTNLGGGNAERRMQRLAEKGYDPKDYLGGTARNTVLQHYSNNPENIGNLRYGSIDAVITSPPYAHESTARGPTVLEREGKFKMGHSKEVKYTDEDYRRWDKRRGGNIGKLKMFVRVPASPEEADYHDRRPERKGTIWEYTKEVMVTVDNVDKIQGMKRIDKGRTETYVEAMLKVYSELYKVLKPGGKIMVIVKPFIRKKKVVDLPYHTMLMMERAGFKIKEALKYRLKNQSFWRILYYKKNKDVPRINHEYIIIGEK